MFVRIHIKIETAGYSHRWVQKDTNGHKFYWDWLQHLKSQVNGVRLCL